MPKVSTIAAMTIGAGVCEFVSTTAGAPTLSSKHTPDTVIQDCREILHQAMNVLSELKQDPNDLDIPDRIVRYIRMRHERLTARTDKLEVDAYETHTLNPVKIWICCKAWSLRSDCKELSSYVMRTSDVAKNKRLGNGELVLHRVSSNYSLISITSENGEPVAVEMNPTDIPPEVLRSLEAMDAPAAATATAAVAGGSSTTPSVMPEEGVEGETGDDVNVTDSDGTANYDGSLTLVGIVTHGDQDQADNVEVQ